mmetsp:Transcript_14005/g.33972  ORF Transcript_14005/g.33972 Transcript_14005/m.33972 type:complete len:363 (+) Transcript_14005:347-1435(+)
MQGVAHDVPGRPGRGDVVGKAADGDGLAAEVALLPLAQDVHQHVRLEPAVEQLAEEVQVRHQSSLQDDRNVRGVEQLDGVVPLLPPDPLVLHRQVHPEPLEVDHDKEHQHRGQQVGQIRGGGAVESVPEGRNLVGLGDEHVEEGNQGPLELGAFAAVQGGRREGLPHDALTDVRRNKQGDPGPQPVPLLHQLIQRQDDDPRQEELEDDQDGVPRPDLADVPVHAGQHVGDGLPEGHQQGEQLLGPVEEHAVFLEGLVDLDDLGPGEELHHHAGRDDRGDPQLHECPAVGSQDHTSPVERIRRLGGDDSVQGNLAASQEDEQGDSGPQELLLEKNGPVWGAHLGEDTHQRLHQVQEAKPRHGS